MSPTRARKLSTADGQKTIILRLPESLFFDFRKTVLLRQEEGSGDSGNDVLRTLVSRWVTQQAKV